MSYQSCYVIRFVTPEGDRKLMHHKGDNTSLLGLLGSLDQEGAHTYKVVEAESGGKVPSN